MTISRSGPGRAAALMLLLAGAVAAAGHPAQAETRFSIAPQSLGPALLEFSRATGLRLVAPSRLLAGRRTAGVSGALDEPAALQALLAGTGLSGAISGGTITVAAPAQADPAAAGSGVMLDPITLTAGQETAWGAVEGVAAEASATGTKTDTRIVETPQSVYVVPAAQVTETGATNIPDALAYTPGVSQTYGWTMRTGDQVQMRGFEVWNALRDGMTYTVNTYDGQQEPYGLERIEVLKGASSVLYGNLRPGGMINTVSKRPTEEPFGEVNLELGSDNRKQVSADSSGAIGRDWSWRLTGLWRDSGTFIDYVPDDRRFLAAALQWRPGERSTLTFLSEFQRDRTASFSAALPAQGVALPNVNGTIPRSRFLGEPDYDRYVLNRWTAGYVFEHDFADNVHFRHALRYYQTDQDNRFLGYDALEADQRTVRRSGQDRDEQSWGVTSDSSVQIDWSDGFAAHKTLVGLDLSRLRLTSRRYSRTAGDLDLFDPVYGAPVGPRVPAYAWGDTTVQAGLYAQDQITVAERWVLVVGGRKDWVTQSGTDPFTGAVTADHEKSDAFTGRAGLVYLAPNGLAPYVSFSQSFEPVTGSNRLRERFVPTRGEQYEIGLRYQPEGSDTLISAAVYQLTQKNNLTSDPADDAFSVQLGKMRSRGFELEARTALGDDASLIAAYAYTDAITLDGGPMAPQLDGKRTGGIPRHMASLWVDYRFVRQGLPGLKVGAGLRHVGEVPANWAEFTVPAHTVVDAMASYEQDDWKLMLNINNLLDEEYASCPADCFWGQPRRVALTASRRW